MSAATLAPANAGAFLFAGKALFALAVEVEVGGKLEVYRFDYKLERAKDGRIFFAKAAVDAVENWAGRKAGRYAYLGAVPASNRSLLRETAKSELRAGSDEHDVLAWYLQEREAYERGESPCGIRLEVSHRGFCGRCARVLGDPDSLRLGLGPVCREHE